MSTIDDSSVSASVAVRAPVTAVETSSVAAPAVSPAIVGRSFAPAIVIVTVCTVPSVLVNDSVSVVDVPEARAWTAEFVLSKLYVHAPSVIE